MYILLTMSKLPKQAKYYNHDPGYCAVAAIVGVKTKRKITFA